MMKESSRPIVVIGSVNSDVTYHVKTLPKPGETVLATDRHDAPGGKGSNQCATISSFGIPVVLVAAVGADGKGAHLIDSLVAKGIDTDHIMQVTAERTGSAIIIVDGSGENSIVVHGGANLLLSSEQVIASIQDLRPEYVLAQLEVPVDVVIAAARVQHKNFILNPAPIPTDITEEQLEELLKFTHILIPNRSELARLTNMAEPNTNSDVVECAKKLNFVGTLIVTLGSDGALVFPQSPLDEPIHVPSPSVQAVDTSGAGDAFCGALVSALHHGDSLIQAVTKACEFASWTTTQLGAQVTRDHGFDIKKSRN
jgi:ribokinase